MVEKVDGGDKERVSLDFIEGVGYMVGHLMKKMNFIPWIGCGKYNQGITEFPDFKLQNNCRGPRIKGEDAKML